MEKKASTSKDRPCNKAPSPPSSLSSIAELQSCSQYWQHCSAGPDESGGQRGLQSGQAAEQEQRSASGLQQPDNCGSRAGGNKQAGIVQRKMARFLHRLWSSRPQTYLKPGTKVIKSLQWRPFQLQPHRGSDTGVSAATGWHQLQSMERGYFLLGLTVRFCSLRKMATPYSWLDNRSQFLTLSLNDMNFLLALWLGSLSHSRRHCLPPCLTDLEPGHVWPALTKKNMSGRDSVGWILWAPSHSTAHQLVFVPGTLHFCGLTS